MKELTAWKRKQKITFILNVLPSENGIKSSKYIQFPEIFEHIRAVHYLTSVKSLVTGQTVITAHCRFIETASWDKT